MMLVSRKRWRRRCREKLSSRLHLDVANRQFVGWIAAAVWLRASIKSHYEDFIRDAV
jgi:hypothetical protein